MSADFGIYTRRFDPPWTKPIYITTGTEQGPFLHHLFIDGELVETKESDSGRSVQFDYHLFSQDFSLNRMWVEIVPKNPPPKLSWGDIEVRL